MSDNPVKDQAIADFVGRLSISYRALSGNGLQEVIDLAIGEFGVPRELIYDD